MPLNLIDTSNTSTSLSVEWSSPENLGERDDLYYTVEYSDPDNVGVMLPMQCREDCLTDTSCNVTGLRPATTYVVRVTAHNGVSDQDAGGALARQREITLMTAIAREFIRLCVLISYALRCVCENSNGSNKYCWLTTRNRVDMHVMIYLSQGKCYSHCLYVNLHNIRQCYIYK